MKAPYIVRAKMHKALSPLRSNKCDAKRGLMGLIENNGSGGNPREIQKARIISLAKCLCDTPTNGLASLANRIKRKIQSDLKPSFKIFKDLKSSSKPPLATQISQPPRPSRSIYIYIYICFCLLLPLLCQVEASPPNEEGINQSRESTQDKEFGDLRRLFNFSKTQTNIVVIVLDRADGYVLKEELKKNPDRFSNFLGFSYFPNALSSSNYTSSTLSSIIGGDYFIVNKLNERPGNLDKKIAQGYSNTLNAFYDAGYEVQVLLDYPVDVSILKETLKMDLPTWSIGDYASMMRLFYISRHRENKDLNPDRIPVSQLASLGLFKAAPFSLRKAIYRRGKWAFSAKISYIDPISEVFSFKGNLNNTASKPTFKFLHFDITHNPYILDSNCLYTPLLDHAKHEMDSVYGVPEGHYNSEVCAFKWLNEAMQTLQDLGVYDNTEIFIVSDHGARWDAKPAINTPIPFLYKPVHKAGAPESRMPLKTDLRAVTNYDLASIFCDNLEKGCPLVKPNILKNYPKQREIETFKARFWSIKDNPIDSILIDKFLIFKWRPGASIWEANDWRNPD